MESALKAFQVIDEEELAKYKIDCCIIGSDEVWNIKVAQFQNLFFTLNLILKYALFSVCTERWAG